MNRLIVFLILVPLPLVYDVCVCVVRGGDALHMRYCVYTFSARILSFLTFRFAVCSRVCFMCYAKVSFSCSLLFRNKIKKRVIASLLSLPSPHLSHPSIAHLPSTPKRKCQAAVKKAQKAGSTPSTISPNRAGYAHGRRSS